MDATCAIQASIHVFSLVRKYVSRILGTYHFAYSLRGLSISRQPPFILNPYFVLSFHDAP